MASELLSKLAQEVATTGTASREPNLPAITIPNADPHSILASVKQIKTLLDTVAGRSGSVLDKALTMRDLMDAGLMKASFGSITVGSNNNSQVTFPSIPGGGGGGGGGGVGYVDPRPVLVAAPTPTNLTAIGAFKNVILTWDLIDYQNHAYVEVWRSQTDNVGTATKIGQTTSNQFADASGVLGTQYYYWVRATAVAADGSLLIGAFNAAAGTPAGPGLIGTSDLTPGLITADQLASGAVTGTKLADAAIAATKFANGIEPVSIVSSVPGTKLTETIFNTADSKLYRWNGTSYVTFVSASDISGQITGSQVASGAIGSVHLTAELDDRIGLTPEPDTDPPAAPTSLASTGGIRTIILTWTNPGDGDLAGIEVFRSSTNDRDLAMKIGESRFTVFVDNVATASTYYYWVRAFDRSGNIGAFNAGVNAGVLGTTDHVNGGDIDDGAITDNHVTNISANKITTGTLVADRIAAGTITGDKIAAGTIVAGNIAANTITGGHIASNTITTGNLAAGSVTTGILAAGAVSAAQIAAGAITASKLTLVDRSNIYPDFEFTDTANMLLGATFTVVGTSFPTSGQNRIEIAPNISDREVLSVWIQVEPSAEYFVEAMACQVTAGSGVASIHVEFGALDASGAVSLTRRVDVATNIASTSPNRYSGNATTSTSERRIRFVFKRVGGGNVAMTFGGPEIRRRNNASLIVDGAITANKLAANSIAVGTAAIQNGAIVNAMIGTAAIDSANIADAAIVNAKIANSAITTAKISDATITTAKIVDASITTAKISTAAITNALIADASITNAKIFGTIQSNNYVTGSSGWAIDKSNGSAEFQNINARGQINGGAFTGWAWPPAGQTGFHLGPNGLLLGNVNNGSYIQITEHGNLFAPGFSIIGGVATFSGQITTPKVITKTLMAPDAVTERAHSSKPYSPTNFSTTGGGTVGYDIAFVTLTIDPGTNADIYINYFIHTFVHVGTNAYFQLVRNGSVGGVGVVLFDSSAAGQIIGPNTHFFNPFGKTFHVDPNRPPGTYTYILRMVVNDFGDVRLHGVNQYDLAAVAYLIAT